MAFIDPPNDNDQVGSHQEAREPVQGLGEAPTKPPVALPVLFVGDAYTPKGFPTKKLFRLLSQRATVVHASEFRSSKNCCACGGPVSHPMKVGGLRVDNSTTQCRNRPCALRSKFLNRDLQPTATVANLFAYSHFIGGELGILFIYFLVLFLFFSFAHSTSLVFVAGTFAETESGTNASRRLAFFNVFKIDKSTSTPSAPGHACDAQAAGTSVEDKSTTVAAKAIPTVEVDSSTAVSRHAASAEPRGTLVHAPVDMWDTPLSVRALAACFVGRGCVCVYLFVCLGGFFYGIFFYIKQQQQQQTKTNTPAVIGYRTLETSH